MCNIKEIHRLPKSVPSGASLHAVSQWFKGPHVAADRYSAAWVISLTQARKGADQDWEGATRKPWWSVLQLPGNHEIGRHERMCILWEP